MRRPRVVKERGAGGGGGDGRGQRADGACAAALATDNIWIKQIRQCLGCFGGARLGGREGSARSCRRARRPRVGPLAKGAAVHGFQPAAGTSPRAATLAKNSI